MAVRGSAAAITVEAASPISLSMEVWGCLFRRRRLLLLREEVEEEEEARERRPDSDRAAEDCLPPPPPPPPSAGIELLGRRLRLLAEVLLRGEPPDV